MTQEKEESECGSNEVGMAKTDAEPSSCDLAVSMGDKEEEGVAMEDSKGDGSCDLEGVVKDEATVMSCDSGGVVKSSVEDVACDSGGILSDTGAPSCDSGGVVDEKEAGLAKSHEPSTAVGVVTTEENPGVTPCDSGGVVKGKDPAPCDSGGVVTDEVGACDSGGSVKREEEAVSCEAEGIELEGGEVRTDSPPGLTDAPADASPQLSHTPQTTAPDIPTPPQSEEAHLQAEAMPPRSTPTPQQASEEATQQCPQDLDEKPTFQPPSPAPDDPLTEKQSTVSLPPSPATSQGSGVLGVASSRPSPSPQPQGVDPQLQAQVEALAQELLEKWSKLKEVFRIPKRAPPVSPSPSH